MEDLPVEFKTSEIDAKIILPTVETSIVKSFMLNKLKLSKCTKNIEEPQKIQQSLKDKQQQNTERIKNLEKDPNLHPDNLMKFTTQLSNISTISDYEIIKLLYEKCSFYIYQDQHDGYSKFGISMPNKYLPRFKLATTMQLAHVISIYIYNLLLLDIVKAQHYYPYIDLFITNKRTYVFNVHIFVIYDEEEYKYYVPDGDYAKYVSKCMENYPLELLNIRMTKQIYITQQNNIMDILLKDLEITYGPKNIITKHFIDILTNDTIYSKSDILHKLTYQTYIDNTIIINRFYRDTKL